ncbi:MAG: thiamine pyrophosphate-dependent enzyme [Candidatus Dadabacteria bacterium]|nr:thiamine pyrophosphate-dependent enzyme [Candidatus Dadabacteria bacterium]
MVALYDREIDKHLLLGDGKEYFGNGALVILKSLLESGISYFTSYPGSPTATVTSLVDRVKGTVLKDLGIYADESTNEAAAAATLRASISNPVRGAVAFKVVGFNVAADAVAHVTASGVTGGALILVGEDYGCNNTIIAEKTLPFAYKSGLPIMDPGASLQHLTDLIQDGFTLSEYSGSPVIVLVRSRVGYMSQVIRAKDNKIPERIRIKEEILEKLPFPPHTLIQEAEKYNLRLPRAAEFVKNTGINKIYHHPNKGVGIITHGILTNIVLEAFTSIDRACSVYSLHCLYPIVETEVAEFLADKESVLIVEEGMPNLLEKEIRAIAQANGLTAKISGKDFIPKAGEVSYETVVYGLSKFFGVPVDINVQIPDPSTLRSFDITHDSEQRAGLVIPERRPTFCTGCPERPIFSAIKILRKENPGARFLFSSDIGCYALGGLPPFDFKGSVTGMGTGMASSSALSRINESGERVISFMGDGTFWHSGLTTSVVNALRNDQDAVLVIFYNYHTAMTGHQKNLSTPRQLKKLKNIKESKKQ